MEAAPRSDTFRAMPPRAPPKRKDAIATRARLVRAALDLFTSQGYRATTTIDLAARADAAEATIYRHFTGKDALFNEALREALRFGVSLAREGERTRGLACRERLQRIGRGLVEGAGRDPALVLMLLRRGPGPPLDEANGHLAREWTGLLTQAIAAGKQDGTVRAGAAEVWASIWLAVVAHAVERVAAHDWRADHPNVGLALSSAWDAIAYRGGAAGG